MEFDTKPKVRSVFNIASGIMKRTTACSMAEEIL